MEDIFDKLISGDAGAKQIMGMMRIFEGLLNQQMETMKTMTMTKTQSGDPNVRGIKFDIKHFARICEIHRRKSGLQGLVIGCHNYRWIWIPESGMLYVLWWKKTINCAEEDQKESWMSRWIKGPAC